METQEALDNLDKALIDEGIPEEERQQRIQAFKESIEFGETMSAKLNTMMIAKQARKPKPRVTIREFIEWCLVTFMIGAMVGVLLHQYVEIQP